MYHPLSINVPENDDLMEVDCIHSTVDVDVETDLTVEAAQEREDWLQKTVKALEPQVYRQTKTIDSLNDTVKALQEDIRKPKIALDQFESESYVGYIE